MTSWAEVLADSRISVASAVASLTSRSACSVDSVTSRTTAELASAPVVTTMVSGSAGPDSAADRGGLLDGRRRLQAPRSAS